MRANTGAASLVIPADRHVEAPRRRGSALIVVLWVIVLMSVMVASLAFDSHVEARITQYYRNRTKAYYLALSGLEVARMIMIKQADITGPDDEPEDEDDRWFDHAKRLKEGLSIMGLDEELGPGIITLHIVPEPARRNINQLGKTDIQKEENLERILDVGGVPEDFWPELIESFLDWTDTDGVPRVDGAETEDYYETLDPPYQAKNGPLDTVDELLLIKGFTKEILYGGFLEGVFYTPEGEEEDGVYLSGIHDLLTVYGTDKINVNAAPMRVLRTLPGMDDVLAGVIIEEREGELLPEAEREPDPFSHVNDVFARIPELDPMARNYMSTDVGVFRITSVGTVGGVEKVIWCIAEYANEKLTILRWREED